MSTVSLKHVQKIYPNSGDVKKKKKGEVKKTNLKITDEGVVAVDDADVAAFRRLQELGVELEIQKVPTEGKEDVSKLFQ